jgi:hypothetical protein
MQVSVTGIGWYRREDYDRLKAMFVDGHKLPATYDGWFKSAQGTYDKLTREGHIVVKVEIDPGRFPEWCRARGMVMDAKARAAYGNESSADKKRQLASITEAPESASPFGTQKAAKDIRKIRIRFVAFFAALVTLHASTAIWGHILIGKNRLTKVSPTVGITVGSVEMVFVVLLLAYAWWGAWWRGQRLNERR